MTTFKLDAFHFKVEPAALASPVPSAFDFRPKNSILSTPTTHVGELSISSRISAPSTHLSAPFAHTPAPTLSSTFKGIAEPATFTPASARISGVLSHPAPQAHSALLTPSATSLQPTSVALIKKERPGTSSFFIAQNSASLLRPEISQKPPVPPHEVPFDQQLFNTAVDVASGLRAEYQALPGALKEFGYWGAALPQAALNSVGGVLDTVHTLAGAGYDWAGLNLTKSILNAKGLTSKNDINRLPYADQLTRETTGSYDGKPKIRIKDSTPRMKQAGALIDGVSRLVTSPREVFSDLLKHHAQMLDEATALKAEGKIQEGIQLQADLVADIGSKILLPAAGGLATVGKGLNYTKEVARKGAAPKPQEFLFLDKLSPLVKKTDDIFDPFINKIPRPNVDWKKGEPFFVRGPSNPIIKSKPASEMKVPPPTLFRDIKDGAVVVSPIAAAYALSDGHLQVDFNTDKANRIFNFPLEGWNMTAIAGNPQGVQFHFGLSGKLGDWRPPAGLGMDNSTIAYWRNLALSVMPRVSGAEGGAWAGVVMNGLVEGAEGPMWTTVSSHGAFGAVRLGNVTNRLAFNFEKMRFEGELFASPVALTFQPWATIGAVGFNQRGVDINQVATYKLPLKKGDRAALKETNPEGNPKYINLDDSENKRVKRAADTIFIYPGYGAPQISQGSGLPAYEINLRNTFTPEPIVKAVAEKIPNDLHKNVRVLVNGKLVPIGSEDMPIIFKEKDLTVFSPEDEKRRHRGEDIQNLGRPAILIDNYPNAQKIKDRSKVIVIDKAGEVRGLLDQEIAIITKDGSLRVIDYAKNEYYKNGNGYLVGAGYQAYLSTTSIKNLLKAADQRFPLLGAD